MCSALEWVIEQYQVKTDKRSGIVNDPNRLDDEGYIVRLTFTSAWKR
jgi:predicted helicase